MIYSFRHDGTPLRLFIAIGLDTIQQILWKQAAVAIDTSSFSSALTTVFRNPLCLVVIAILPVQLWNWLKVLDRADLSYAMPITAMSYATVGICSYFIFCERLQLTQIFGLGLIICGVWCIAQTEPTTEREL
jgi:multidrug transporter EmrE-like cation transporter